MNEQGIPNDGAPGADPVVRPQYHWRKSEQGWRAWDVLRLIRMSASFAVVDHPLADIAELDEPYWFADNVDMPSCRDVLAHASLIEAADLRWPIILDHEGRVMDGMHRICKAAALGSETLRAVQFDKPVKPDHVGVNLDDLPLPGGSDVDGQ